MHFVLLPFFYRILRDPGIYYLHKNSIPYGFHSKGDNLRRVEIQTRFNAVSWE